MTSADAVHRKSGALARGWRDFRRWRRGRPFWAGFFTLLSGLVIYGSTQLSFANFQIKIGNEGFLSYVIPLVLLLCALLIWFTPQQRIFYGVIAAAVALYSFIGVNFGGFFLGMLLGIIGGSLAVAWTPVQPVPPAEESTQERFDGPAEDEAAAAAADPHAQPEARVDELLSGPLTDVLPPPVNPLNEPAQPAQPTPGAHRYDEPEPAQQDVDDTQHIPAQREGEAVPREGEPVPREGEEEQASEEPPRDRGNGTGPLPRRTPRLFAITLVPMLLTAVAIAGTHGGTLARAEPVPSYPSPCPTGTKPASPAKARSPSSSASKPAAGEPAEKPKKPSTATSPAASPSPSTSPSPSSTDDDGGGLVGDVLDGVGDLLGIGDEATPSPSVTPSPAPSATPGAGDDASAGPAPKPDATPSSAEPSSAKPTKSASAAPKPTSSANCVVVDPKQHKAEGVPTVQKIPDTMTGSRLTLEGFAFDGVTELNTADGTIRVLQFSMSKAVTDDFKLLVPGPGEHKTSLTSSALTVRQADGGEPVKFYCTEFTGTLKEPIPLPIELTFTPESPPLITFPQMVFTGITIKLVFVDTDVLEAPNLDTKILT